MDTQHIDTATEYLTSRYTAREYGDRLAYVAPETGEAYLVGPEALELLGRYIAGGVSDAYSQWCSASTPEAGDMRMMRDEAAAAGDMATVIAIDMLA